VRGPVASLLLVAVVGVGCGSGVDSGARPGPPGLPTVPVTSHSAQPPDNPRFTGFPHFAVTAVVPRIQVYDAPDGRAIRTLANPNAAGAPLTFLLKTEGVGWLEVYLPVRPNGSTGWVRLRDVRVTGLRYEVEVFRKEHRLHVLERGKLRENLPIAVGRAQTPTPGGLFYLAELLIPTNHDSIYGPFAYGLSGFSNTVRSFKGGPGVIGLHGTNDESSIGHDVSHGCIRLHNADIVRLAKLLPLGTPVRVLD
jgi:lipoprotein-anchoring transpeptidase ErfK/SrfK